MPVLVYTIMQTCPHREMQPTVNRYSNMARPMRRLVHHATISTASPALGRAWAGWRTVPILASVGNLQENISLTASLHQRNSSFQALATRCTACTEAN